MCAALVRAYTAYRDGSALTSALCAKAVISKSNHSLEQHLAPVLLFALTHIVLA